MEIGRERFGVDVKDLETAIRSQIQSGDWWLTMCAIATAAELRMKTLSADIAEAARTGGPEVAQVARAASAALA